MYMQSLCMGWMNFNFFLFCLSGLMTGPVTLVTWPSREISRPVDRTGRNRKTFIQAGEHSRRVPSWDKERANAPAERVPRLHVYWALDMYLPRYIREYNFKSLSRCLDTCRQTPALSVCKYLLCTYRIYRPMFLSNCNHLEIGPHYRLHTKTIHTYKYTSNPTFQAVCPGVDSQGCSGACQVPDANLGIPKLCFNVMSTTWRKALPA